MTTITCTLKDDANQPLVGQPVQCRLIGAPGHTTGGELVSMFQVRRLTGSDGVAEFDELIPNSAITPVNSYYKFTVIGARDQEWNVTVPDSGIYEVGDLSIQATPPEDLPSLWRISRGMTAVDLSAGSYPLAVDLSAESHRVVLVIVPDAGDTDDITITLPDPDTSSDFTVLIVTAGAGAGPLVVLEDVTESAPTRSQAAVQAFDLKPNSLMFGDAWLVNNFGGTFPGLMSHSPNVVGALGVTENYLDLLRYVKTYVHAADVPDWPDTPIDPLPIGRDGHQIVTGDNVVVTGLTDGSWYGIVQSDKTLVFDTPDFGVGALTGGARFLTAAGVRGEFESDTYTPPYGVDHFGDVTSTGTWVISPWPLFGTGAPDETLGEDGCTYIDTGGPAFYTKAAGTWTAAG